ncbi:response regulator [candidate division KSB1 bacterium]|nr:MAG: response regulator [candidate division KSB1 bacterium]
MVFKLIVVDDEEQILQALSTFFGLRGYEVMTTSNPEEALERMRMEKFHVALIDINMPRVTGIELLKQIKEVRPTVQVIMMTAYTTIEKAIECVERGASDYLLKPFQDLEELADIVKMASERVRRWEVVARESLRNPKDVTAHRLNPGA